MLPAMHKGPHKTDSFRKVLIFWHGGALLTFVSTDPTPCIKLWSSVLDDSIDARARARRPHKSTQGNFAHLVVGDRRGLMIVQDDHTNQHRATLPTWQRAQVLYDCIGY